MWKFDIQQPYQSRITMKIFLKFQKDFAKIARIWHFWSVKYTIKFQFSNFKVFTRFLPQFSLFFKSTDFITIPWKKLFAHEIFIHFFEKRTGTMLLCIKYRPNMTESKMVTSKFVFYIKFLKFWYITLLVTKLSTILQNSGAISWTVV